MPRRKAQPLEASEAQRPESPPLSQEARETRIISMAMDLAEERIRNGTASAQEVTYWLRLGSQRDKLEREMMEAKNELLLAKTEAIKAAEKTEQLYAEAIKAFRMYGGEAEEDEYDEEY